MKAYIKCQSVQTLVILLVFVIKYEPGKVVAAVLAATLAGIIAAVVVTRVYSERESAVFQVGQIISLSSIVVSAALMLFSVSIPSGITDPWIFVCSLIAMGFSYFSVPTGLKWHLAITSLLFQLGLIELSICFITLLPY